MKDKVQNPILAPNKVVAAIFYVFMTFIGSGLIIILIAAIYSSAHQIPFVDMMEALKKTSLDDVPMDIRHDYLVVNSIGNMLGYILMLVGVGFYMRNYLIEDTKKWKLKYRYLLWFLPVSAAAFYGISYGVDKLIGLVVSSSENQLGIEAMILDGGAFYMFIAVVICAPIVEELIYRKLIFSLLEKKHIAISYVISILCFSIPHMMTTSMESLGNWLLMCIPYMVCGFLLCLIYHLSGKNTYASWFAHMINNLVAFIKIL